MSPNEISENISPNSQLEGLGLRFVGSWAGKGVLTKGGEIIFMQKSSQSHDGLAPDLAGDCSDAQKSRGNENGKMKINKSGKNEV